MHFSRRHFFSLLLILISKCVSSQVYPSFGNEIKVFIAGYSGDAMEPFLSADGTTLFFNSLNDGIQTRLFYATRIDDTTFTYVGEVNGANEPNNPQLNAVASLDTTGNFVWVSTRGYPGNFDNLHRADYSNGNCTNVNRVHGNFYVYQPGYIVMDAMITYDGSQLIFCNAFFDTCTVPCAASIGFADRINDSTFNVAANSTGILQNVNDTNYCVYAPQLSDNGLELYFTRYLKGSFNTEICVSVRNTTTDTFSVPQVLVSDFPDTPEAAGTNVGATLFYYHKKTNGTYTIYMRERIMTAVEETSPVGAIRVFPNPACDVLNIAGAKSNKNQFSILNSVGEVVRTASATDRIYIGDLPDGIYFLSDNNGSTTTFSICR